MKRYLLMILAVGLLLAADEPKEEAVKKEMKKLEGTWTQVSVVVNGEKVPEDKAKALTLILDAAGKWSMKVDGKTVSEGTFKIDPSKKPKTADFLGTDGDFKGKTTLDIYEFDGDTLRFCYVLPEKDKERPTKERPSKFASEAGSGHILSSLKREKSK
jgi:uncharacterized protein (TIGR03067 family)